MRFANRKKAGRRLARRLEHVHNGTVALRGSLPTDQAGRLTDAVARTPDEVSDHLPCGEQGRTALRRLPVGPCVRHAVRAPLEKGTGHISEGADHDGHSSRNGHRPTAAGG
ncbi:hypothetical protein AB0G67_30535 [Streptomyces sp. NPDC021056]|uniref:hypothetical protein n=1 Tax=Streptomyces sp. NPDC021056 TaxID=3155012 RepID=UPI0033DE7740